MADRRATELETKADEMDVEQHVHFSPRRQYYWLAKSRSRSTGTGRVSCAIGAARLPRRIA